MMKYQSKACVVWVLMFLSHASAQQSEVMPSRPVMGQNRIRDNDTSFVEVSVNMADFISNNFWQPITTDKLLGQGILKSYQRFRLTPPPDLVNNPDEFLKTRDLQEKYLKQLYSEVRGAELARNDQLISTIMESMVSLLDPHTHYINMDDSIRTMSEEGARIGITLEDRQPGKPCYIRGVALDSPAKSAGLAPGDELLAINDVVIPPEYNTSDILMRITFQAQVAAGSSQNRPLVLQTRSLKDGQLRTLKVGIREYEESSQHEYHNPILRGVRPLFSREWDHWASRAEGIALFRVGPLNEDVGQEISKALTAMNDEQTVRAVVLDLRECTVGRIDACVGICQVFLQEGMITKTKYRRGREDGEYRVNPQLNQNAFQRDADAVEKFIHVPLVVLVGPETSGGGELIAAALQDNKRAIICGQRTRGKSTIQMPMSSQIRAPGFHSLKLTCGQFYRPSMKNLQRMPDSKDTDDWGVIPDAGLNVPLSGPLRRQIRSWWFTQDCRPDADFTQQPLDHAENDPVLNTAIMYLRDQLNKKDKGIAMARERGK